MSELVYKAKRFLSRGMSKAVLPELRESIVTFGFDDCPSSAIETALPILEAEGWRATVYVACGLCETENHLGKHMSLSDIVGVHSREHEIADHTFTHLSSNGVSTQDYMADIERNQDALKALGLPASQHFAYPYGHVSPALKRALGQRFKTSRGVLSPANTAQDANLLNAVRVYSGERFEMALDHVETAKTQPQWLNLFTHDVRDNPSDFGCTREEFLKIVMAVRDSGLRVMTVNDAYKTLNTESQMS